MRNQKHELGLEATDKITGFKGTITGIARYITGCDQYLVQPKAKDGDHKSGTWFDEGRLVTEKEKVVTKEEVESNGDGACGTAPIK